LGNKADEIKTGLDRITWLPIPIDAACPTPLTGRPMFKIRKTKGSGFKEHPEILKLSPTLSLSRHGR